MKKTNINIVLLFAAMIISLWSCQDFDNEIGRKLDPSELDFTVVQDYSIDPGGNTVILTNNTPQTIPVWDYGTGKSNRAIDTIHFAFAGDYTIKFSAITDGGVVEADPITITVTGNNFNYVSDPIWELISGGVGHSKTWLLDVDADGVSKYWNGPMFFYGSDIGYLEEGGDWGDGVHTTGCYGTDCWLWDPNLGSIQGWGFSGPADFGEMTFGLTDGATLDVNHLTLPSYGEQHGSYYIDINSKMLTTTNATILHDSAYETCVGNWNEVYILSITEDAMQLGVIRSCDPVMLSFNFISKEYSDNWEPEEVITEPDEGFEPTFESGELLTILTGGIGAGRFWKLDGDGNPVDWIIGGNGWTTGPGSSADWGWNDGWADTADSSWIRFDQYGGTWNYLKSQDGVQSSGTFTINEDTNEVTLSDGGTLIQTADSWMNPTSSTFTVIKAVPDDFASFGLWFGTSYNADNDEWLSYHYIVNTNISGGNGGGPIGGSGTEVTFDNSKILYGDIEGNGNLRIEIYNDFGSTALDPPLNTADLVFDQSLEVTFTISGVNLFPDATGSYVGALQYADADWSFQYWGNGAGSGDTTVTGNGTYTVSLAASGTVDGAVVFVIDLLGMASDITDLSTVMISVDQIVIN